MDALKNISNLEDKDILVSLPRNRNWLEYLSQFMELKSSGNSFNIILRTLPKTAPGKKCFIIFDGFLRGWMEITKIKETVDNEICIELLPNLISVPYKLPMEDVEEFTYFFDNSNTQ